GGWSVGVERPGHERGRQPSRSCLRAPHARVPPQLESILQGGADRPPARDCSEGGTGRGLMHGVGGDSTPNVPKSAFSRTMPGLPLEGSPLALQPHPTTKAGPVPSEEGKGSRPSHREGEERRERNDGEGGGGEETRGTERVSGMNAFRFPDVTPPPSTMLDLRRNTRRAAATHADTPYELYAKFICSTQLD
ncbi:hypothetical protein CVT26_006696, partial [Gymnopilus dilepis]